MSRKVIPIVIAAIVLFWVLSRGERDDPDVKPEAETSQAMQKAGTSTPYALDVKRATWPPLEDGAAPSSSGTLTAINYYIVFDASGSMLSKQCGGGSSKFDAALDAVRGFIAS